MNHRDPKRFLIICYTLVNLFKYTTASPNLTSNFAKLRIHVTQNISSQGRNFIKSFAKQQVHAGTKWWTNNNLSVRVSTHANCVMCDVTMRSWELFTCSAVNVALETAVRLRLHLFCCEVVEFHALWRELFLIFHNYDCICLLSYAKKQTICVLI